jgi:hypothetical protein
MSTTTRHSRQIYSATRWLWWATMPWQAQLCTSWQPTATLRTLRMNLWRKCRCGPRKRTSTVASYQRSSTRHTRTPSTFLELPSVNTSLLALTWSSVSRTPTSLSSASPVTRFRPFAISSSAMSSWMRSPSVWSRYVFFPLCVPMFACVCDCVCLLLCVYICLAVCICVCLCMCVYVFGCVYVYLAACVCLAAIGVDTTNDATTLTRERAKTGCILLTSLAF